MTCQNNHAMHSSERKEERQTEEDGRQHCAESTGLSLADILRSPREIGKLAAKSALAPHRIDDVGIVTDDYDKCYQIYQRHVIFLPH